MKRIAYSLLLVLLLSCASRMGTDENRIRVQIRDGQIEDFFLLAVRSDCLVVAPFKHEAIPADSLIAHAKIIQLSTIQGIAYKPEQSASLWPGLGGCAIGAFSGCLGGAVVSSPQINPTYVGVGFVGGGVLGFFSGMAIAHILAKDPDYLWLLNPAGHIDKIRHIEFFRNYEPPELQLIK